MHPRPPRAIEPSFEPPTGLSLAASAALLGSATRAVPAQLVDVVVRGVVGVETEPEPGPRPAAALRLLASVGEPTTAAAQDDRELLSALFGPQLLVGTARQVDRWYRLRTGIALRAVRNGVEARLLAAGLVRERRDVERPIRYAKSSRYVPIALATPLIDRLWGVHDYLTAPEPAAAVAGGDVELLRRHTQLLPYAVLFRLEQRWVAELMTRLEPFRTSEPTDDIRRVVSAIAVLPFAIGLYDLGETIRDENELLAGLEDTVGVNSGADKFRIPDEMQYWGQITVKPWWSMISTTVAVFPTGALFPVEPNEKDGVAH